jgi:hypothetical protein
MNARVSALLAAVAAVAAACGGAAPAPVAQVPVATWSDAYASKCQALAAEHGRKVADQKYVPVDLMVHDWPSDATPTAGNGVKSFMPEAKFVELLVGPQGKRIRTALVLARGGTGKSALAAAVQAQGCGKAPVLRVDLNLDIAAQLPQMPAGQNAVAVAVAKQLALDTSAGANAAVQKAFGVGSSLVVILDSLDEVPLLARPAVVAAVDDFVNSVATTARTIVMARPPVFTSNYGLGTVDARLELPSLQCSEVEAGLAAMVSPTDASNFQGFIQRYGLNRKVTAFERCYYPHMSTRRDLEVLTKLAANSAPSPDTPNFERFQSSRAQVYTYFATAMLLKDLQGLPNKAAEALALVDAMVATKNPSGGQRNLAFVLQDCVAASSAANKQELCERLLNSRLFGAPEPGSYHFANQSIGDLFLARWTEAQIAAGGKANCAAIDKLADLLESSEVAGFLVGLPAGQSCLGPIAAELTRRSGCSPTVFELLDQGLPGGPERKRLLEDLDLSLVRTAPSVCLTALVEGLVQGNPVAPKPTDAKPVEADTKSKGKKSKKKGK